SLDKSPASFEQMIEWIGAHQRAAGIGGHAVAQAAQHGVQRLAEEFSFDVPERHVDAGNRQSNNTAWTRACRRRAQFLGERFDAQRILADQQIAELIYGVLERGVERAAEEYRADAFDTVFRLHAKSHELIIRTKIGRSVRQRLFHR